jgi:membrane-associated phospholipid phosphatase
MRIWFRNYTFVDYATQFYAALAGSLIVCFHNSTVPRWPLLALVHVAILVFVHSLLKLQAAHPTNRTLDFLRHFYPVLLYIWFYGEVGWLNRMFFSDYMDPACIRLEQAIFGCQPGVLFMHKLPYLLFSEILYTAYFSYYLMIGGVGLALFLRSRQQFFHYISVLSFIFYVCYFLFLFLPIIGPRAFFHEVPGYKLPPDLQALAVTDTYPESVRAGPVFRLMGVVYQIFEGAPGATLPSSHVAIALCTLWFSFHYLRPVRYPHLVLVILLCLATVYGHYHYALDVVTGILTAAVLIPVGNRLYARFGSADSGISA